MTTSPPLLTDEQLDDAAAALARAFFDDPLLVFTLPDRNERERLGRPFFNRVLRHGQMVGEVYTTPGIARAAAVWIPPNEGILEDGSPANPLDELPEVVGEDAMRRFDGVMDFLDPLHKRAAPGPHWYLGVIGVHPSMQGRGVARSLIEHIFVRADATQVQCYLETAEPKNVPFYVNRGFEVLVDAVDPHSGLRLWTFIRRPTH